MKPKGIRKRGAIRAKRFGYTGIAIDLLSTISGDINTITESVEVNKPTTHQTNTIAEIVGVVVTP